jgi:alcohol dehydrogenase (cytochrome c)
MYVINGKWTFAIDVETGKPIWRTPVEPEAGVTRVAQFGAFTRGELDSLYTSSVLAIRPKTGEIVCYYQYTPNDVYDTDGADENVLADLQVNGQLRKVMIQANKNGFMYVLDRTNCKPIAAHPFVKVNWATHVDLASGRPVLTDVYKKFLAGDEVEVWPSRGMNAVPSIRTPGSSTPAPGTCRAS